MFYLFLSELKRFRLVALIACIFQLFVWVYVGKMMVATLAPSYFLHAALMICALGGGIGIGAIQMWLHTRKNHWTYLVHRPLSLPKIHLALSAAALAVIAIGLILPFFSVVAYLDVMTNNVVDMRHYLMAVYMLLISTTAYFITSYVALSSSKLVIISLWMLTYLGMRNHTSADMMLLIASLFALLSFYLAHNAFKIDLSRFSDNKPMIALSSIALQPLLFILLVMVQAVYYHLPLTLAKAHPSKDLTRDTSYAFKRLEPQSQFSALLEKSPSELAPSLQRQLPLAEFKRFKAAKHTSVTKGQLFTSDRSFELWGQEEILWVFSHQHMVFKGRNYKTDQLVGYFTQLGFVDNLSQVTLESRFADIPNIINNQTIYTKDKIYTIDFEHQTISLLYQTIKGETIYGKPVTEFELTMLRTSSALLLFDKTDAMTSDSIVSPLHRVSYPTALENRINIQLSQMTDGYLVLFSSDHFYGYEQGGSELVYVPHEGDVTSLAQQRFIQYHFPRLLTEQYFTLSPIVVNLLDFTLGRLLTPQKSTPDSIKYFWQRDYPSYIWQFCLVMAISCALITLLLAKRLPMSNSNRWLWAGLSLVGGLPALGAFLILNSWRDMLRNSANDKSAQEATNV